MNKKQAKVIKELNYHNEADQHETNWDTFKNKDGMTYYVANQVKVEVL